MCHNCYLSRDDGMTLILIIIKVLAFLSIAQFTLSAGPSKSPVRMLNVSHKFYIERNQHLYKLSEMYDAQIINH